MNVFRWNMPNPHVGTKCNAPLSYPAVERHNSFLHLRHWMELSDQPHVPEALTLERNGESEDCYSLLRRHGVSTSIFYMELPWTLWRWGRFLYQFFGFPLPVNIWRVFCSQTQLPWCVCGSTDKSEHMLHRRPLLPTSFPLLRRVKECYSCCLYVCLNYS